MPNAAGREFAAGNAMMIAYRRSIFAKVVAALQHIGLLTDRVREGLDALDLLGRVPRRRGDGWTVEIPAR